MPSDLRISEIDLCAVIGNLLDNATEACIHGNEPWIRVYIGIPKGQLYISVSNSVSGEIKKSGEITCQRKAAVVALGFSVLTA